MKNLAFIILLSLSVHSLIAQVPSVKEATDIPMSPNDEIELLDREKRDRHIIHSDWQKASVECNGVKYFKVKNTLYRIDTIDGLPQKTSIYSGSGNLTNIVVSGNHIYFVDKGRCELLSYDDKITFINYLCRYSSYIEVLYIELKDDTIHIHSDIEGVTSLHKWKLR